MHKFDPTQLRPRFDNTNEGWLIQVYSGDRRLICVLESSHAWMFLLGCGVGILLGIGWCNLAKNVPSTMTYGPATKPSELWID